MRVDIEADGRNKGWHTLRANGVGHAFTIAATASNTAVPGDARENAVSIWFSPFSSISCALTPFSLRDSNNAREDWAVRRSLVSALPCAMTAAGGGSLT